MSTLDTERDWQPTTTGVGIAVATTAIVVVLLLGRVDDVVVSLVLGGVGAVLFTASCWLVSREHSLAVPLVSLLTVPVALGIFGSSTIVALTLSGDLYPVEDGSLVSIAALIVVGNVGVVAGIVVAMLGVAVGYRNVLDADSLGQYSTITFQTVLLPAAVGGFLVVDGLVFGVDGPTSAAGEAISGFTTWLVAPDPTGLNVAGFLLAAGLAFAGVLAASVHLAALGIERHFTNAELRGYLGPGLYDVVGAVAAAGVLRVLLVAVAGLTLAAAAAGLVARHVARASMGASEPWLGPVVGGGVITVVAIAVAEPVYRTIFDAIVEPLPASVAAEIRTSSTELTAIYGEATFTVLLAVALVASTLWFVLGLRIGLFLGYLSEETAGYSLASAGLFVGTVFAGTLGAPSWLVFAGVAGSLLVWDSGRFATTLGREIGRPGSTRDVELVHAGGSLVVGVLGVLAATGVTAYVGDGVGIPSPATSVALVVVAVGLLSLVAALR
ncbi:hypothetical protein BRC65_09485 [Halobacteriales archaeon QH_2_65_14]|nr:MAG: hypothetical protein BRC65_09485 [Halobacteriales archaeon QH_2_65_14]